MYCIAIYYSVLNIIDVSLIASCYYHSLTHECISIHSLSMIILHSCNPILDMNYISSSNNLITIRVIVSSVRHQCNISLKVTSFPKQNQHSVCITELKPN